MIRYLTGANCRFAVFGVVASASSACVSDVVPAEGGRAGGRAGTGGGGGGRGFVDDPGQTVESVSSSGFSN